MTDSTPGPDLSTPRHVHVIGIGGAGMGAIAEVLLGMGHRVSGSDLHESVTVDRLRTLGADARVGHDAANLVGSDGAVPDVVVRSTAIPDHNVEVQASAKHGLRVLARRELLGEMTRQRRPVAIAGTHGKTTTTSMLAVIAVHAGLDPTFIVGGDVHQLGSGANAGAGEWFVVEADESDGTFLDLHHEIGVVTNVERDHLEHYGGEASLRDAFEQFARLGRHTVLCGDDPGAAALVGLPGVTTYGTSASADHQLVDIARGADDIAFTLRSSRTDGSIETQAVTVPMPGLHNALNATAAITTARLMGVSLADAAAGIASFRGVGRRFEARGNIGGVRFVDDYAHLPTEVSAAVTAACDHADGRVIAVFQPHRYSRTEQVAHEFAGSFDGVDLLVLTDVYAAGETPRPGIDGRNIVDAVRSRDGHPELIYHADRSTLAEAVLAQLQPGDLCLTLGAGDLLRLPDELRPLLTSGGGR